MSFPAALLLYKTFCTIKEMKTYTVSQAREKFAELLDAVDQCEEVAITKHGSTVATITRTTKTGKRATLPPPGFLKAQGWTANIADDFDSLPEGFGGYV